jgi:hypothetical protein
MLSAWRGLAVLALALALLACGAGEPAAPPLNSERIEQIFGSYGIDVLYSDARLRISSLYSTHDGIGTTRTLAIVGYPAAVDARLAEVHAAIQGGASIGATFQSAGWTVVKRNLFFGVFTASAGVSTRMRIPAGAALATHGYALVVTRGDLALDYATIAELHHPDYLDLEALAEIYGAVLQAEAGEGAGEGFRRFVDTGLARLAALDSAERE